MSSSRISGSLGLAAEADGANGGALARLMPMLPGTVGLAKVGQELLLDFAQMALDLVGVIDPTPISDGTSMVISLGRREYSGAAISGLSMVPFIGDLAKSPRVGPLSRDAGKSRRRGCAQSPDPRSVASARQGSRGGARGSARHSAQVCPGAGRRGAPEAGEVPWRRAVAGAAHCAEPREGRSAAARGRLEAPPRASQSLCTSALMSPPPVPASYLTVERLIESAPGGAEFLKHVDLKSRNVSYRDVEQMWSLLSERGGRGSLRSRSRRRVRQARMVQTYVSRPCSVGKCRGQGVRSRCRAQT
jgi:hypothetical protein